MKKLMIIAAVSSALAVSTSALAQGTIVFANSGSYLVTDSGTSSGLTGGAATWTVGLYLSTSSNDVVAAGSLVGTAGVGAPFAGIFSGGNPYTLPNGWTTGETVYFEYAAWSTAAGADYATALATGNAAYKAGVSAIGYTVLGGGALPAGSTFGPNGQFPGALSSGWSVSPVPEPTTLALAGLGAAALLIMRRRK